LTGHRRHRERAIARRLPIVCTSATHSASARRGRTTSGSYSRAVALSPA